MKTLVIGLTDRLERAGLSAPPELELRFVEMLSTAELAPELGWAEAIFTNPRVTIDQDFLDACPNVKFIQLSSAGFERIDVDAIQRRGVIVANSSGQNADAVAEWTLMCMLALQRELLPSHRALSDHRYQEYKDDQMARGLPELGGKTLGIIGLGNVGKRVARRAKAFNTETIYYDIVRPTPEEEAELGATYCDTMDEVLRRADILTVHVPWTAETFHLVGEEELSMLKPTALVINAARGPLVDPAPLAKMLKEERLAGAALDVFETEPAPDNDPIIQLAASGFANILVTPHRAGVSREAQLNPLSHSLAYLSRVARGEQPTTVCIGPKTQ
jgi:phosphoglycerate dehydrogenase-like enzyme